MATERMYDLAFDFKQSKLWQKVREDEIFAVRLSDGQTGYCSVMGASGHTVGVSLYVGEEGYQSLWHILEGPGEEDPESSEHLEWLLGQDCLQCVLENREMLSEEEVREVRGYAKEHGLSLRGKNNFPHFKKCAPNRLPWFLASRQDQRHLTQALSAALELSRLLREQSKRELGLEQLERASHLLLLEQKRDHFVQGEVAVPPRQPVEDPRPKCRDEIMMARLRQLRRGGAMLCEQLRLSQPFRSDKEEAPFFPALLLCADAHSGYAWPILSEQADTPEEEGMQLLVQFAQMMLEERKSRPREIRVREERSFALLEDFCAKAKIPLRMYSALPALDSIREEVVERLTQDSLLEEEFYDEEDDGAGALSAFLAGEEMRSILNDLFHMSAEELSQMPRELLVRLALLGDIGLLPRDFEQRLRRTLREMDDE